ncbi:hypothetical protein SDC9_153828 [bioreactor metagenome]|uniref:Uncharacterized protein n=1 Tax=bioreactor metagenome TaxID=1076179 RepID=A0A645EZ89_9ZZZZ
MEFNSIFQITRTLVSAGRLSSYQATSSQRRALTTHELGHNLGATHGEAYNWYVLIITTLLCGLLSKWIENED